MDFLNFVSFLVIFGTNVFKMPSNVDVDIRKKFQNPALDLYSRFRAFSAFGIRSSMKSVALYFFPANKTGTDPVPPGSSELVSQKYTTHY